MLITIWWLNLLNFALTLQPLSPDYLRLFLSFSSISKWPVSEFHHCYLPQPCTWIIQQIKANHSLTLFLIVQPYLQRRSAYIFWSSHCELTLGWSTILLCTDRQNKFRIGRSLAFFLLFSRTFTLFFGYLPSLRITHLLISTNHCAIRSEHS